MIQALLELFGGIFAFAGHITGGSSFPEPLSPEEEKDCIARLEAGDAEARHGIVLAKNDAAKRCGVATGNPLWPSRLDHAACTIWPCSKKGLPGCLFMYHACPIRCITDPIFFQILPLGTFSMLY